MDGTEDDGGFEIRGPSETCERMVVAIAEFNIQPSFSIWIISKVQKRGARIAWVEERR